MEPKASPAHRHPYSARRHAGQDVFVEASELQLGAWRPADIVDCWGRSLGAAPSFWISGERKAGRTSFLRRLEHLLLLPRRQPAGGSAIAVPIYVSSGDWHSLADLYLAAFRQAGLVLRQAGREPAGGGSGNEAPAGEIEAPLLEAAAAGLDLFTPVQRGMARWARRLADDSGRGVHVALLVDHSGEPAWQAWIPTLFSHLRALLAQGLDGAEADAAAPVITLSVAVAGGAELEQIDDAARLLDVLEPVVLRQLSWHEVRNLVTERGGIPFDRQWVDRIYGATGGHPWLIQYVMENVLDACQGDPDPRELERVFDAIVKYRFQRDGHCTRILKAWLDRLPERGVEILAHLALDGRRAPDCDLTQRVGLQPKDLGERLRRLVELGVVFKQAFRGDPYALTGLFEDWFFKQTGGGVFLAEIERRQQEKVQAGRREAAGKPFQLMVSPELIVADGLSTCFCRLQGALAPKSIKRLRHRALIARTETDLEFLAQDLERDLVQKDWMGVWEQYLQETRDRQPICVLRVEEPELFDLPIELMRPGDRFLGLAVPVFKELLKLQAEPAYHLSAGCFAPGQAVNVLLVASSLAVRDFESYKYLALPQCELEVIDIVNALAARAPEAGLELGRVVVLTNGNDPLPDGVERRPATSAELQKALRERVAPFHLFHYSGHYVSTSANGRGGFLFGGSDGAGELFGLSNLEECLNRTSVRLAFFNACSSGAPGADPTAYYLEAAPFALSRGVRVVIGNRWPIGDSDARLLGRSFYSALARCGSVEVALWRARVQVRNETPLQNIAWAAPVMLAR